MMPLSVDDDSINGYQHLEEAGPADNMEAEADVDEREEYMMMTLEEEAHVSFDCGVLSVFFGLGP